MYFDANKLEEELSYSKEFFNIRVYRNDVIKHLNQSLLISSPLGGFGSFIKAFQDKYIELKN
tara:strand:+ start:167 stop:352 length:186 start_codon:yes stop_codon:yes gene_type:complete